MAAMIGDTCALPLVLAEAGHHGERKKERGHLTGREDEGCGQVSEPCGSRKDLQLLAPSLLSLSVGREVRGKQQF